MQIIAQRPELKITNIDGEKSVRITFTAEGEHAEKLLENADYLIASQIVSLDIDRAFPKRSRNANAMFWALCEKMATAIGVSHDEMYLMLLDRYGSAHVVTVDVDVADAMEMLLKEQYKWIKRLGGVMINGRESVQFFCHRGSHEYNTKEMSRLIEGTIQECKELGIPTDAPQYVKETINEWGV